MKQRKPWLLVAGLTLTWLLLAEHLSLGQLLLGAGVSLLMVFRFQVVRPVFPRLRRPASAFRLLGRVIVDVLKSNYNVSRVVLGLTGRELKSGFVDIPLQLRDPHALATLAAIVTSTPGTAWANLSDDGATLTLTLHVLDLDDEASCRNVVQQRYETLLMEIFE